MQPANDAKPEKRSLILGVGFDGEDGHVRVTRGENFRLVGGSEETHGVMQEKAVRLNEKLQDRGMRLEDVSREEFRDIARELGLSEKQIGL